MSIIILLERCYSARGIPTIQIQHGGVILHSCKEKESSSDCEKY